MKTGTYGIEYFPPTSDKLVVKHGFASFKEAEDYVLNSLNNDVDDLSIFEIETTEGN